MTAKRANSSPSNNAATRWPLVARSRYAALEADYHKLAARCDDYLHRIVMLEGLVADMDQRMATMMNQMCAMGKRLARYEKQQKGKSK